jgi:hypothetical protein
MHTGATHTGATQVGDRKIPPFPLWANRPLLLPVGPSALRRLGGPGQPTSEPPKLLKLMEEARLVPVSALHRAESRQRRLSSQEPHASPEPPMPRTLHARTHANTHVRAHTRVHTHTRTRTHARARSHPHARIHPRACASLSHCNVTATAWGGAVIASGWSSVQVHGLLVESVCRWEQACS